MKNFHILIKDEVLPSITEALEQEFTVHKLYESQPPFDKINALVTTYAAGEPVTAQFLSQFPNLKIISHFGVGYNTIDTAWAKQNNVVVTNTPDVLTEEVADLALGLTLATIRELPQADKYLRDGAWEKHGNYHLTASLRGRTMGIVGLGRIGKAIAKRAEAFGVEVVYHGRTEQKAVPYKYYANLEEMATACDLLMVAAPGGEQTKNIINANILKALGPQGILINIARGTLVDQPALIHALKNNIIHSAGLDVYDDEPRVPEELKQLKNVVLLPHVGSGSIKTRAEMGELVVNNIRLFSQNKQPQTPVPEAPYIKQFNIKK